MWAVFFLVALLWALAQTGIFQREVINAGGWTIARRFLEALLQPALSAEFLRLTLQATLTTLAYAVGGAFLSLVWGFVAGILASETWWRVHSPKGSSNWRFVYKTIWLTVRAVLAFLRAIHEIVWGLFFINVIGLDPLSAILAISLPFGAIVGKVFSEILDETPQASLQALLSSGVSPGKAFAYTLLPAALPDLLSYSFYRFECAIRAAAVLGIIGAGGLGYEIALSLQTLKYDQIWTLLFALFALNGAVDLWSSLLRRRIGVGRSCAHAGLDLEVIHHGNQNTKRALPSSDPFVRVSLMIAISLVPLSFIYIQPDLSKLISSATIEHLRYVASNSLPLAFDALPWQTWLDLAGITLAMSLLAVAGAAIFSLPLSFPAANNFLAPGGLLDMGYGGKFRRFASLGLLVATRGALLVARSVPPPIWALILLFVFFPGILPGALALGLYTIGVLGRLNAEAVENLDVRPLRALKAVGGNGAAVFAYGVIPPATPRFVGYTFYRWEETIRATVVVGLVGAGGLGRLLTEQLSSFDYRGVLTTLIIFVALTFLVDLASARARKAFREA